MYIVTAVDELGSEKGSNNFPLLRILRLEKRSYVRKLVTLNDCVFTLIDVSDLSKSFEVYGTDIFKYVNEIAGYSKTLDSSINTIYVMTIKEWLLGSCIEFDSELQVDKKSIENLFYPLCSAFDTLANNVLYRNGYILRKANKHLICPAPTYLLMAIMMCKNLPFEGDCFYVPMGVDKVGVFRITNKSLFTKLLLNERE